MSSVLAVKTYLENNISQLTSFISSSSLPSNLLTTYSKQLNAFIVFNQIFSLAYSNTYPISDIQIIEYFQSISQSFVESCALHTPIVNSSWSIYLNIYSVILNI